MKIYKFLLYYFIIQLVYKIIISEKNIENNNLNENINNIFNEDIKYYKNINENICININENKDIDNNDYKNDISYFLKKKNNKNLKKKLNNIYEKFLNKKNKLIKPNNDIINEKDKIIFKNDNIKNIVNNRLKYTFESKKDFLYKINFMSYIENNNINNFKLLINNSNQYFEYDFCKNNILEKNIKKLGFILDNNNFNSNDNINIEIIFLQEYNNEINNIQLSNIFIEIIEKNKINNNNQNVIIFNVNENNYPLYFNSLNILEYCENNDINKSIDEELFFM
jgi:hypothetical protein